MMAVARGDLRARLTTSKGVAVLAVWVAGLNLVALFGVTPDGTGDDPALSVVSWVVLGGVSTLCAAVAGGEVAVPGEKGLPDLATAFFSARDIAWGKAVSALLYTAVLSLLALPALAFLAALRALPWTAALGQVVAIASVGWTFGGIGTWLGGAVENDFLRSLALWTAVGGVLGVLFFWGTLLPLEAVSPFGPASSRFLWIGGWGILGTWVFWLCARQVERLRRTR